MTRYVYTRRRPGGFGTGCGGFLLMMLLTAFVWVYLLHGWGLYLVTIPLVTCFVISRARRIRRRIKARKAAKIGG